MSDFFDKTLWSKTACGLSPYVPGEQPKISDLIKLNTNENPYPPSPKVLVALQECANADLRLYPDPESMALRQAIAKRHGISADMVFAGNGSDEVLGFAFRAFFDEDAPIAMADITYSFYRVYCKLFGLTPNEIPLRADFSLPAKAFEGSRGGVVIANPNAPTGMGISLEQISGICANNSRVVIVDEAYIEFAQGEVKSAVELLDTHKNLLVVRTFSKSHSLAGLRVGYAMGSPDLIGALCAVKDSFNSYPLDRVAQACAAAAIADEQYYSAAVQAVIKTRDSAQEELNVLGFTCLPSCANFIFAAHPKHKGDFLAQSLREHGILVRRFSADRISDFLRITIGTQEQMQRLYYSLRDIISG